MSFQSAGLTRREPSISDASLLVETGVWPRVIRCCNGAQQCRQARRVAAQFNRRCFYFALDPVTGRVFDAARSACNFTCLNGEDPDTTTGSPMLGVSSNLGIGLFC